MRCPNLFSHCSLRLFHSKVCRHGKLLILSKLDRLRTSTVVGKKLTNIFYEKAHKKSYFLGCSLGGRQGIKAAEMFPDDFDGIVAGAPALDFNDLQSWRASFYPITGPDTSPNFISKKSWTTLIHDEILKQCDGIDGALDGIIEDPSLCNFRPEAILCKQGTSTDCLTSTQVDIVRGIFSPLYGNDKNLIYPAMQPGSEILAAERLYAGRPFSNSEVNKPTLPPNTTSLHPFTNIFLPPLKEWFKYIVYSPSYDATRFTVNDAAAAEALNPANIRTWPSSLSSFQKRGGKILAYHGGQDNQITSFNTERFYSFLSQGMRASPKDLDGFFRFFRVAGMFHCNSGPGAWVIGQGGGASAEGIGFEREGNVLAALVQWVEKGVVVEDIVGTKFVDDKVDQGVAFRHRHCR